MKNSKKCKKNGCKNNNANSMNEAQLESVQGGMGGERDDWALYGRKMPAGLNPGDGARNWMPGDGARGKQK